MNFIRALAALTLACACASAQTKFGALEAPPNSTVNNSAAASTAPLTAVTSEPSGACTVKNAIVLYQVAGAPEQWSCTPSSGTDCPCVWTKVSGAGGSFTVASQAEAEAGTENTKGLTALRGKQLVDALAPVRAVSSTKGTVALSSGTLGDGPYAVGLNSSNAFTGANSFAQAPVMLRAFGITMDYGASDIPTGVRGYRTVPYPCTIQSYIIHSPQTGDIQIALWKDVPANFPPTVADIISASAPVALSADNYDENTTLTGWTKDVAAKDVIAFNVVSNSGIKFAEVTVYCK
jgi:hypothetical protein